MQGQRSTPGPVLVSFNHMHNEISPLVAVTEFARSPSKPLDALDRLLFYAKSRMLFSAGGTGETADSVTVRYSRGLRTLKTKGG